MTDPHLKMIRDVSPSAHGCEDCLRIGGLWVHLRVCLTCGHVGCCDSSPHRHARQHFHHSRAPDHPVFRAGRGLALVLRARSIGVRCRPGTKDPLCADLACNPSTDGKPPGIWLEEFTLPYDLIRDAVLGALGQGPPIRAHGGCRGQSDHGTKPADGARDSCATAGLLAASAPHRTLCLR